MSYSGAHNRDDTHQYAFSLGPTMSIAPTRPTRPYSTSYPASALLTGKLTGDGDREGEGDELEELHLEQRAVRLERLVAAGGDDGGKGEEP